MVNAVMAGIVCGVVMVIVFVIVKSVTSTTEEPPTGMTGVTTSILPIIVGLAVGIAVFIVTNPGVLSGVRQWFTNRKNSKEIYQLLQYQALAPNGIAETLNLRLEPIEGTVDNPVQIGEEQKILFSKEFSYYFTEKSEKYSMYKLVGLHETHRNLNCVYVIGKDAHTGLDYLLRLPPDYISKDLDECLRWCIQAGKGDIIKEV